MGLVSLPWSPKGRKLAAELHFGVLLVMTTLIALLYYSWTFLGFRPDWLWHLVIVEFRIQFIGSLFYIPSIYTAVTFRWRGMLIMWLIVVAITVPLAVYFRFDPVSMLINIFYLFIPLLVVGYITLEINWRNRERRALIEREEERQAYVAQIFQAQEDERKRIAQELHDETIQSLLIMGNSLQQIASDGNFQTREQLKAQAEAIRGEIIRISDDLRGLTLDLRPSILDNIGFLPALRWLVDRLNQEGQTGARIVVEGEERKLPHAIDVIAFRIVQEALNNVLLHSKATETILTLEFGDETVKISVHDNGKGFTLPKRINTLASEGRLGLIGIQERVRALNGKFAIKSKPGQGTAISVEFKG